MQWPLLRMMRLSLNLVSPSRLGYFWFLRGDHDKAPVAMAFSHRLKLGYVAELAKQCLADFYVPIF